MKKIAYTDGARRELAKAAAWHDENSSLGGDGFLSVIEDEIERIRAMPFASPPWSYAPRYRARTLRDLKYRIIYEVTEQLIRIVAIAHTSRDPEHWLDRLT